MNLRTAKSDLIKPVAKLASPAFRDELYRITNKVIAKLLKEDADKYFKQKRYKLAERRANSALEKGLEPEDYHKFMAEIFFITKKLHEAVRHIKKCLNISKKDRNLEKISAYHCVISSLYQDAGNKRQARYHALKSYQCYLGNEAAATDWAALNIIAVRLMAVGCLDLSLHIFSDIYQRTNDPLVKNNLFNALIGAERYEEALDLSADVDSSKISDYNDGVQLCCKQTNNTERLKRHMRLMQLFYGHEIDDTMNDYSAIQPIDPEISINGLTIDLKQLNDGSIRILEMNFLPASGLKGYDAHHAHKLEDRINADYAILTNALVTSHYFDPQHDSYLKHRFTGMGSTINFSNWITMMHAQRPVLFNASLHAIMAQHYKDEFALSVQGLGLNEFIPETVVASRHENTSAILERAQSIQTDHLVIKTSNDARGDGVEIIPANRLPKVVNNILNGGAWHECKNPKTWEQDFHPNFLIQECIQSKPCLASDRNQYDATMRVALTHVFNHQTQENTLLMHGMFWKLPKRPISIGSIRDRFVSLANNKDIIKGRPHSARVSPPRQKQVQKQLGEFFSCYGAHMASPNSGVVASKTHIAKVASSRPIGFLATEQLTSHPYGNLIRLLNKGNPNAMRSIFDFSAQINNPHMDDIKQVWLKSRKPVNLSIKEERLYSSRIPKQQKYS